MRRVVISFVALAMLSLNGVVAGANQGTGAGGGQKDKGAKSGEKEPIGSNLTREQKRTLLTLQNDQRASVGVGKMTWSAELATFAQKWADHLASGSCAMEHRPASGTWKQLYGESIYMGMSATPDADAVAMWAAEKQYFKGQPLSTSDLRSLHYTQMVWSSTTQVGCAIATCGGKTIVVCNYSPAGNTMGQKPY